MTCSRARTICNITGRRHSLALPARYSLIVPMASVPVVPAALPPPLDLCPIRLPLLARPIHFLLSRPRPTLILGPPDSCPLAEVECSLSIHICALHTRSNTT